MGRRLELQRTLEETLGSKNVYFQPPRTIEIEYPCIVYQRDSEISEFADNLPYMLRARYQITIIDWDPDSKIPFIIARFPMCRFNRFYTMDNLNHWVYNIYY